MRLSKTLHPRRRYHHHHKHMLLSHAAHARHRSIVTYAAQSDNPPDYVSTILLYPLGYGIRILLSITLIKND